MIRMSISMCALFCSIFVPTLSFSQDTNINFVTVGDMSARAVSSPIRSNVGNFTEERRYSCITIEGVENCTSVVPIGYSVQRGQSSPLSNNEDYLNSSISLYTLMVISELQSNKDEIVNLNKSLQDMQLDRLSLMQTLMLEKINQLEQPDWSKTDWESFKSMLVDQLSSVYEPKQ